MLLTATIFNIYSGVCIYLIIFVYCCFVLRARIIVHHQNLQQTKVFNQAKSVSTLALDLSTLVQ